MDKTHRGSKSRPFPVTYRIPALIYISVNRILLAFAEKWKTADDTDVLDTGKTWSDITDLTADVIGEQEKDWATFAVGPGHGVQTKSGRLIIPTYVYPCNSLNFKPTSRKGSTWHLGKCVDGESNECQMAEIIDDKGNSKLYYWTWLPRKCVEFCPDQATEKTWLLYCHPTNPRKRACLGVYLNKYPWDASGWEDHKLIIYDGPNGYSDLAQCGDGKQFACLMECGEISEVFKLSDII
uniref:exo-alpha-sialidase n=1 Tax=Cyprinus carpio TaxID=7962 RepID=A0A8C2FE21_CYPCA